MRMRMRMSTWVSWSIGFFHYEYPLHVLLGTHFSYKGAIGIRRLRFRVACIYLSLLVNQHTNSLHSEIPIRCMFVCEALLGEREFITQHFSHGNQRHSIFGIRMGRERICILIGMLDRCGVAIQYHPLYDPFFKNTVSLARVKSIDDIFGVEMKRRGGKYGQSCKDEYNKRSYQMNIHEHD